MRKLIMFGKYFGYNVGGAEASMLAQAKAWADSGAKVETVRVTNVSQFQAQELAVSFPSDWQEYPLRLESDLPRFKFFDYFRNRKSIAHFFAQLPSDRTLVCYGLLAPAAMRGFKGRQEYFIRDELGAGLNANYYRGWRKFLKMLYLAIEWPFFLIWRHDLQCGVQRAEKVVVNAKFMAELTKKLLKRDDVEVLYSRVQIDELRKQFMKIPRFSGPVRVVCVGDNILKGADVFRAVAKLRPQVEFHLFDRQYKQIRQEGNIFLRPWAKQPVEVYRLADILMAPSQWLEAYPRVVMEAASLGVPVLASTQGGIPEAVERHGSPDRARLLPAHASAQDWARALDSLIDSLRLPQ